MKFYKDNIIYDFYKQIYKNKLTAICNYIAYHHNYIWFFKNGKVHNTKNIAYIIDNNYKHFYLHGKDYGNQNDFNKKLWRRFVKLRAFL
jgi:hypothetical protein